MVGRDGSPFDCEKCTDRDKEQRNCFNRLGLSEAARAVVEYTGAVVEELKNPLVTPPRPPFGKGGGENTVIRKAQKVFSLGDIRLYECPVSYISRDTVEVMRLVYLIDDSGALLHGGGWGGQPAWLVEAVEVFRVERMRGVKAPKDSNALTG